MMHQAILMQIKKVFWRSDVLISLLIFALIPFVIAYLISIKSGIIQIGNSVFSTMGYASVIIGLLKSLFLIGGIVALVASSVVAKEIDSGLDCSYFTKLKKQEYLFVAKSLALFCFITLIFLALILSSAAGWYVFLRNTDYGNSLFTSNDTDKAAFLLLSMAGAFLEMLTMCELFCVMSLLFKYSKAVLVNLSLLVLMKLLANIESLQRWVPSFIGDGSGMMQFSGRELVSRGTEGLIILFIYACVLVIAGTIIYRKMDLVR